MRLTFGIGCAAALMNLVSGGAAAEASVYKDPETGFTFSQNTVPYSLERNLIFRVAVPSPVPAGSSFDIVIQVVAPVQVGWTGLAWGGRMTNNPLTVSWANGNSPVVSSRYATAHAAPSAYNGATYQVFRIGTRVNSTHWQYTAKCTGCSTYLGAGNKNVTLNPAGSNALAFAYSSGKPTTPSSSTSTIPVHEVTGYWNHDFSTGANTAFASLVAKNL